MCISVVKRVEPVYKVNAVKKYMSNRDRGITGEGAEKTSNEYKRLLNSVA